MQLEQLGCAAVTAQLWKFWAMKVFRCALEVSTGRKFWMVRWLKVNQVFFLINHGWSDLRLNLGVPIWLRNADQLKRESNVNDCDRTGNGVSNRGKRRGAFQCCKAAAKLGEKKDVTSWNSTAIFSKNFAIPKWVVEGSWGMIGKQLEHLCEDPWVKKNKQFDKFTSQWHLECFIEGFTQLTTQPETVNLKFLRLIPKFCNDFPPEKKAGQHRFRFLLLDFRKKLPLWKSRNLT